MLNLVPVFLIAAQESCFSPKEDSLTDIIEAGYGKICFFDMTELAKVKYYYSLVWVTFPAPLYVKSMFNEYSTKKGLTRFAFGSAHRAKDLLLVEDIEKWCHHKIEFDQIRNVYNFKLEIDAEAKTEKEK